MAPRYRRRVSMDDFNRDVIKYMLLWAPHGALYDEDLYPRFGMDRRQFHRRFGDLVRSLEPSLLTPADRLLLMGARRYLALRSRLAHPHDGESSLTLATQAADAGCEQS